MNIIIELKPTAKLSRVNDVYEFLKEMAGVEADVIESIELVRVE